jgi:uncharacterized protein (TIGR02284 family)
MKNTEVLNDLIEINNDRVKGYEKAANQANDEDLRTVFNNMAMESRQLLTELRDRVQQVGGKPEEGTTARGKIYRTWMDVKATFGGDDRKSLLASCEFGEDAAQDAYRAALKEDDISPDIRQVLEKQKQTLRQSHDTIKRMRDTNPAG